LASRLLLLLAGLLLPAAALLSTLSGLLAALVLTTLTAALTALLTALVLILLISHFRLTPTRDDSRAWTTRHLASVFLVAAHAER
jgi:hypothetical protein